MDTVIDWLSLPDGDRPDFLMLYFDEPDHTGHGVGPDGPEVRAVSQLRLQHCYCTFIYIYQL